MQFGQEGRIPFFGRSKQRTGKSVLLGGACATVERTSKSVSPIQSKTGTRPMAGIVRRLHRTVVYGFVRLQAPSTRVVQFSHKSQVCSLLMEIAPVFIWLRFAKTCFSAEAGLDRSVRFPLEKRCLLMLTAMIIWVCFHSGRVTL